MTQAQEGVQLAEERDDVFSRVLGYWGLGHVCSLKGDLSRAGALLERALALSSGWNFPIYSADIRAQLGYVYALSERVPEGLARVGQACADLESLGVAFLHSLAVAHLGEACLLGDRLEEAHAAAARVLSLARERGERGREADALRLLGDVAAHRERLDVTAAGVTTHKPWPWPPNSACARSWPTATSGSASLPAGPVIERRPRRT